MFPFYNNILITTRLVLTKQERTIRSISHVLSLSRVLFLRKGNFRFKQTVNIRIQKKCESIHGNRNEKKSVKESISIMSIASDEVGLLPFPFPLRPSLTAVRLKSRESLIYRCGAW
jgi:hypothetical protein